MSHPAPYRTVAQHRGSTLFHLGAFNSLFLMALGLLGVGQLQENPGYEFLACPSRRIN